MAFKRYRRMAIRAGGPRASIWKHGQIGINRVAAEKYELLNYDYAVLFYDEDTKTIGIMPTNDEQEEGIIKLVKRGKGSFHLAGGSFLRFHDIDHSEQRNYPLEWDAENNLYTFKLE